MQKKLYIVCSFVALISIHQLQGAPSKIAANEMTPNDFYGADDTIFGKLDQWNEKEQALIEDASDAFVRLSDANPGLGTAGSYWFFSPNDYQVYATYSATQDKPNEKDWPWYTFKKRNALQKLQKLNFAILLLKIYMEAFPTKSLGSLAQANLSDDAEQLKKNFRTALNNVVQDLRTNLKDSGVGGNKDKTLQILRSIQIKLTNDAPRPKMIPSVHLHGSQFGTSEDEWLKSQPLMKQSKPEYDKNHKNINQSILLLNGTTNFSVDIGL